MMTRKLRLHTLLVLLALCQFATVFGAGKHIKLNLKKGETYKYSQSIDMNIKQAIQGQDVDMNIKMITHTSFYVTDVSGNIFTMDITYDKMSVKMGNGMMNFDFNTEEPAPTDNPVSAIMFDMVKAMINKKFQIKIDNTGNILELDGVNGLLKAALDEVMVKYPALDEAAQQQLLSQMEQSYGEESFKGSFETYMNIYPPGNVNINDSWKKNMPIKNVVSGIYNVEYKLDGETATQYSISGNGNFMSNSSDYSKVGSTEAKYNLKGIYTAELKINKMTGWIEAGTFIQKLSGEVQMKANEQLPEDMTIPMTISINTLFN